MTKRILITGKSSYIGSKFIEWIKESNEGFHIDTISVRSNSWKDMNFSQYDTILHLAGIAHVSKDPKMEELYYSVNRDLTINLAEKAKEDGVKQFIFMSSIIVYGDGVGADGLITKETIPKPRDFYGNSKLQAEEGIKKLIDNSFKVVIIRPPMIYGEGSKGNYPKLAKLARIIPVFPDINNKRSMLYINNLCEILRLLILKEKQGIYHPQNKEYVKTSDMVKIIASVHNKNIHLTSIFNFLLKWLKFRSYLIEKMFGDLYYQKNMNQVEEDYNIFEFKESIVATERANGQRL